MTTARAVGAEFLAAITEHRRAWAARLMHGICELSCAYAGSVKEQASVKVLLAREVFLGRQYGRAQRGCLDTYYACLMPCGQRLQQQGSVSAGCLRRQSRGQ